MVTPFSSKCEILNDFYLEYSGSDEYNDFIQINDLGFPAATLFVMGAADLTDVGKSFVDKTWNDFCELFSVDHLGEYSTMTEIMEMSDE